MKSKAWTEKVMQGVFFIAACTSVLAVALICIFLFANGIPAIREIGFVKFITGDIWRPGNKLFGIFPMIIGSIYVTAGAIIFGVPIGRFFRTGRNSSDDPRFWKMDENDGTGREIRGWKRRADNFDHTRHDDSSNDHRNNRKCHAGCTGAVL